ncbi:MAG: carboxypeptidase regulatory-like domain-containing protein [Candidatus Omnitrophota bacterium]
MRQRLPLFALALVVITIVTTIMLGGHSQKTKASKLNVSVDTGSVEVKNEQDETSLSAGERASVTQDGIIEKKAPASSQPDNAAMVFATSAVSSAAAVASATLTPLWITGYSLTDKKEPLAQTEISLYSHIDPQSPKHFIVSAHSDERGYYTIQVPQAGRYILFASPKDNYSDAEGRVRISDQQPTAEITFTHYPAPLSIRGKVVDVETKKPIAGARLSLEAYPIDIKNMKPYSSDSLSAVSGEDGRFTISKVPIGTFNLCALAKGYAARTPRPWRDPQDALGNLTFNEQTQNKEYLVELTPGGSVLVRVKDSKKSALPNINVAIAMQGTNLLPNSNGITNERGEYRNDTLPKGKGAAIASERRLDDQPASYGMTMSDFFETRTVDNPAVVDILMSPPGTVSGRVSDGEGKPVSAILFSMMPKVMSIALNVPITNQNAETNESGDYILYGLGEGEYDIQAQKKNERGMYSTNDAPAKKTVSLKAGENKTGVDFVIDDKKEGETIRGIVKDQFGEPVVQAKIYANSRNEKNELISGSGEANEQGEFTVSGLPKADQVHVGVFAEGYKSHNEPHKMDGSLIEITMMKCGSLGGVVVNKDDKTPLAGVQIAVDFQSDPNVDEQKAVSDNDGRFQFVNLQPGFYKIIAKLENYSRFERSKVELQPGEAKQDVLVEMEKGLTFIGRLIDPQGRPVAGAVIGLLSNRSSDLNVVHDPGNMTIPDSVNSNEEGIFQLQIPSQGGDKLIIIPKELAPRTFVVSPEVVRPEPVPIPLGSGGTIEGIVKDSRGRPANSFQIIISNKDEKIFQKRVFPDEDGNYRAEHAAVGITRVMKLGTQEQFYSEQKNITIEEGKTVRVDFDAGEGATVQGLVHKGGAPAAEASLILNSQDVHLFAISDESGHYEFKGVPEGEYQIFCTTSKNQYSLEMYNSEGFAKVNITGEQKEYNVNFDLIQSELNGIVLNAETGEPLPGAEVNAAMKDQSNIYVPSTMSDETGQFKMILRYPGIYTIFVAKIGYKNKEKDYTFSLSQESATNEPTAVEFQMERAECEVEAHLIYPEKNITAFQTTFEAIGENAPHLSIERVPDKPNAYRITGMSEGLCDIRAWVHTRDRFFLAFSDSFPIRKGEKPVILMNLLEIANINIAIKTSDGSTIPKTKEAYRLEFQNFPQSSKLSVDPSTEGNQIQIEAPLGGYSARLTVAGYKPVDFNPEAQAEPEWGRSLMKMNLTLEKQ